jgi:ABC-type transport system involved in multi-copper enzyme maturation permease subunit
MSLRDLGYRPYEGERLPPSHNTWVLWRYGISRAWASVLVKLSVFFGWVPGAIGLVAVGIFFYLQRQGQVADPSTVHPEEWVARLLFVQMWIFAGAVTLGAGAGAIAEDFTYKAFQFYFAKPVTPLQYLLGRILAVSAIVFALCFGPTFFLVSGLAAAAPAELRLEWASLFFPALLHSVIIAAVLGAASVGVSALSKSRALTMSAWILLLLVPHVVAALVDALGDFPWLTLASILAMLDVVGDALLHVEGESGKLTWYHAAIALAAWLVGSVTLALYRLRDAEVIT